jgi:MoxR-like ATPase
VSSTTVPHRPHDPPVEPSRFAARFSAVVDNVERVIHGKRRTAHLAVACMLAEGHLLIEDVPGVGKTSLAKALARSIDGTWHRVQFTPDLLPSDVTGVSVWNRATNDFEFRPGGVFAHIVLADEINRASPKTQSALLEAMEERTVTVDATTYALPRPFLVMATQNPVEHEGTYPLPEAQLDRFLMRLAIGYPDRDAELAILDDHGTTSPLDDLEPVVDVAEVVEMAAAVHQVHVAPALRGYLVDVADATRRHPDLSLGVSPRGVLALFRSARALAASLERDYVIPDDVKLLAGPVLEHRMLLAPHAQVRGTTTTDVLEQILAAVPVPAPRGA